MDSLQNPEHFENSSIVQKSSKTGIFSNKRLLVIKTGYLYYFSKVPKGYKSHVPNILTTFTDLPKSSIEIKNILDIRLESAKSANLIIKFYLKDMIDRQDIRKSIDSQFYSMPNKKPNTQTDEWKFMFTTVLQCRLWYNALMKLKDYFKNLEHKFSDFVANFDPKRASISLNGSGEGIKDARSQSDIKSLVGRNSPNNNNNQNISSLLASNKEQQKRNTQPIKFDASKFITPLMQKQSSQSSQTDKLTQKSQVSPIKYISQVKQQKSTPNAKSSNTLPEQQQQSSQTGGYHPNISQKIQPQIPQHHPQPQMTKKPESFMKGGLKESHLIEPIDEEDEFRMRQMEDDIREEVRGEIEQKVRGEVEIKVKERFEREKREEMRRYVDEVEKKDMKIRQLQTQIHLKHLANIDEQRKIQEEKRLLQIKIIEEQEKLNHAKIDFEKQLKLHKLQTNNKKQPNNRNLLEKQENNQKLKRENSSNSRSQKQWLQGEDDQYENSRYDQDQQQQYQQNKSQTKKAQQANLTNPTYPNIHVNQFSVQTDQQDFSHQHESHNDSFEPNFNFSKDISASKDLNLSKETKIRHSFFSDHGVTQRNIILGNDLLRIQDGFSNSGNRENEDREFEGYNYFGELAKIYEQGIASQDKINRQLKLINYVNFLKQKAISYSLQYINQNSPKSCQSFQKGIFSFDLACAPGKIMNIGGENKLIYSNKPHENLKRTYKTYQHLQTQIIKILKSKNAFPVRVPLCTLIEYRGYTILARVQICTDQVDLPNKDKYLKHLLPARYFSLLQLSKTIRSKDNHSQFYMIKVLKPIKLTYQEKHSEILKSQTDFHSFMKAIDKARKSNVSLCYEKLLREYEEDGKLLKDDDHSQALRNQLQLLKMIKLMRELRKIYKSMEPFDQKQSLPQDSHKTNNNNNYNNNNPNPKSHFVQFLLFNPSQLLSLIPSDTDLSTFNTKCGYFYSLLEFFIGIRVKQPVKDHSETSNIQYDILPVSRTYCFSSFSVNQHIDRVEKHLSQRNFQAARKCHNLVKKTSGSSIEANLLEIKILLKQKQYAQAEDKINCLRDALPLHDLSNIELNAYLIQCYVFMGLETQVLKQIRSSIDYVQYMFGGKKNVFETNLHLLMAQTLLRLGNVNQAIKMYKSLIKHDKVQKGTVLISYAQTLVKNLKIDPNQAIPFLLEFIDEINDSGKKIDLLLSVAKLYARTKRIDKRVYYLQRAFQLSLNSKNYTNLLDLYRLLIEQTGSEQKRQVVYKNLVSQVDEKFWINEGNVKKFNTINLYQGLKSKDSDQNNQVALTLNELVKKVSLNQTKFSSIEVFEWSKISEFAGLLQSQSKEYVMNKKGQLEVIGQILQSINLQLMMSLLTNEDYKH